MVTRSSLAVGTSRSTFILDIQTDSPSEGGSLLRRDRRPAFDEVELQLVHCCPAQRGDHHYVRAAHGLVAAEECVCVIGTGCVCHRALCRGAVIYVCFDSVDCAL